MAVQTGANSVAEGLTPGEKAHLGAQRGRRRGGDVAASWALTQREVASLFYLPIPYVVGFIFLLLTGYFFVKETLVPGNEASMRFLFERMAMVLVFAIPLLTMRSLADEFATGSIETLMTAPVTDAAVVFGKFLGTLLFYLVLLLGTIPHLILLANYGDPLGSVVLNGYLGMVLLGALFIAIGVFASACTRHQLLAASISIALLAAFTFLTDYLAEQFGGQRLGGVAAYLNIFGHFSDFSKGILDTRSVIFFVSGTIFFLFLATKVMESRRWR